METRAGDERLPRTPYVLSLLAALLASVGSGVALATPGFYAADPAALRPQLLGQDLVTLVAAPLLAASAWTARRGSLRGHVAACGLLLYVAYAYTTYAFGVRFNALFLVYVAALGMSAYGFLLAVQALRERRLPQRVVERTPRRALVALLATVVTAFGALWLADIVPALLHGGVPQGAREAAMPTSPVHVLDLAFVLPLAAVAAVLLARRRTQGYLLGAVMVVKTATLGLAVLAMALMSAAAGEAVNVPVVVAMGATVAAVLALGGRAFVALG